MATTAEETPSDVRHPAIENATQGDDSDSSVDVEGGQVPPGRGILYLLTLKAKPNDQNLLIENGE